METAPRNPGRFAGRPCAPSAALVVASAVALAVPAAPALDLTVETVAPERPIDLSLALEPSGVPHISYTIGTSLKYAVKSAGIWTVETVDSAGTFQTFTALALDANGAPHVCFAPNGAWYAEKTSGSWSFELIDATASSSQLAIALDSSGSPRVAFQSGGVLRYGARTGSGWVTEPIQAGGWGPSLVLDEHDDPHVAYALATGPLRYAVKKNGTWTYATVDSLSLSGSAGYFDPPSLELDSTGDPHVSYMANDPDYNLKYAMRSSGTWIAVVVDTAGFVGWYNSLGLDPDDLPHVTYTGASNELIYARHDGTEWIFDTLDPTSGVGDFNDLALPAGAPHVAYRDYPGNRLCFAYPTATAAPIVSAAPDGPVLETPRPNPRVGPGETELRFTLPAPGTVRLSVHDVLGRRVASWPARAYPAGTHVVTWDPGAAASGVYWARLVTDSGRSARTRWVLLR